MIQRFAYIIMIFSMFLVIGCKKQEAQSPLPTKPSLTVLSDSKTLSSIAADEKPDDQSEGAKHAASASENSHIVIEINRYGRGVAYIARTPSGVHVVHNGIAGKYYQEIDATTLALSSDGKRVAYCARKKDKWFVVVDENEYGPFDDKGPPVFSPDSLHVGFEAKTGGIWKMHCDSSTSGAAASFSDKPAFSGDSRLIMRMENNPDGKTYRLVISDLKFKTIAEHTFNNLKFLIDPAGQMIAVVDIDGKKFRIKRISFHDPEHVVAEQSYDYILNPVFSADGRHLAYTAKIGNRGRVVVDGKEDNLPDGDYPWPPTLAPDGTVGVIIAAKSGAYPYNAFNGTKLPVPGKYKECADLTYSSDGRQHAYVAIKNERFLIVSNGKEGPVFDRVISPIFSPDGRYLVYRARQDGKRFVVVADPKTGKVIKEHPRYERVFETVFTSDGKSVAYGVKDGDKIMWRVEKLG